MESESGESINCPYCGKINTKKTIKCSCGYYLDKEYKKELEEENKKAEEIRSFETKFISFKIWKRSISFHFSNLNNLLPIFPFLCLPIVGDALHSLLIKQKYQYGNISQFQAVREVWKLIPSLFETKLYFWIIAFFWSFVPIYGIFKDIKYRQYWSMASNVLVFEGLSGDAGRERCKTLIESTGIGVRTLVTMPALTFVGFLLLWVLIATLLETGRSYSLFIFIITILWLTIPLSGAVNSFLYLEIIKSESQILG